MANETEDLETVRKIYVRDLREKQTVHTVFRVSAKKRHTSRAGKTFLALELSDKSGTVDARIFDNVDAAEGTFADGDYVLIKGEIISFHGKPQVVVAQLEKLDPEPIDAAEFTPPPPAERAEKERPEREREGGRGGSPTERLTDPQIKALVQAVLEDPEVAESLRTAPASRTHGAHRGGLSEHLAGVVRLVYRLAEHFPALDRDLAVGGAILRIAARAIDATAERDFDHSDGGRLLGAGVAAAQKLREHAAKLDGFPRALEQHLTHIAIAGEARPPSTLEALVVLRAAALEAEVEGWLELMSRDSHERWTEPTRLLDRPLWKGPVPTARGRSPVAPRAPRAGKKASEKKDGGERRESKEPAVTRKLPSFKPLAEMTPSGEPEQAPAETAPPPAETPPVLDGEAKQP